MALRTQNLRTIEKSKTTKTIEDTINEADAALHTLRQQGDPSKHLAAYSDLFNRYKRIIDRLTTNNLLTSGNSEFIWCKSQMRLCQRLASMVPVVTAQKHLTELDKMLQRAPVNASIKDSIISTMTAANSYYFSEMNRANANYCFAVNLNAYLTTSEDNKAIFSMLEFPTKAAEKASFLLNAVKELNIAAQAYEMIDKKPSIHCIDMLVALSEHAGDFYSETADLIIDKAAKIKMLKMADKLYAKSIKHFEENLKENNPPPHHIERYISRLTIRELLMALEPENKETHRQFMEKYIEENFTETLFDSVGPKKRALKVAEVNAYKVNAGIETKTTLKRSAEMREDIEVDEKNSVASPPMTKIAKVDGRLFSSSQKAVEEKTAFTGVPRPF